MSIFLSGSPDVKYDEHFIHEKYIELRNRIIRENISELYWIGDPYDSSNYTRIIQKLIDYFQFHRFRFVAAAAATSDLGFHTHHCMQLCVYVRPNGYVNKSGHTFHYVLT